MLNRKESKGNEQRLFPSPSFFNFDPFSDEMFFDDGHKIQEIWSLKRQQFSFVEEILPMFGASLTPPECFEGTEQGNFERNHFFEKEHQIKNIQFQDDKFKQLNQQSCLAWKDPNIKEIFPGQNQKMIKKGKKAKKKTGTNTGKQNAKFSDCPHQCSQYSKRNEESQKIPLKTNDREEKKINETKERAKEKYLLAFIENSSYIGCKCAKNKCMTNYCSCFTIGLGCGKHCSCSGCKNYYGTMNKDSSKG